jgi:hypothetical protein
MEFGSVEIFPAVVVCVLETGIVNECVSEWLLVVG